MTLDLTPEQKSIVLDILRAYVPRHEVWVFGSRIKGTSKPYSDLDLAIITQHPLSLDILAALRDAFSSSDLPWKVHIVDWATTQDTFRRIIKAQHIVLQKACTGRSQESDATKGLA